jgi:hypothetical protein
MPKRKFEIIPTHPGLVPNARTERAVRRTMSQLFPYRNTLQGAFYNDALLNAGTLSLLRRFGLNNEYDRQNFATLTGRSNHIMRSLRTMVDRRRRQAYLLLRRVLPVEVSQRILMMNSKSSVTNLLMIRYGLETPHHWGD